MRVKPLFYCFERLCSLKTKKLSKPHSNLLKSINFFLKIFLIKLLLKTPINHVRDKRYGNRRLVPESNCVLIQKKFGYDAQYKLELYDHFSYCHSKSNALY